MLAVAVLRAVLGLTAVHHKPTQAASRPWLWSSRVHITMGERSLEEIAMGFKMEVFDLDGGVIGLDSKDPAFGIRVASATIRRQPSGSLGLGLEEVMASGTDTRGLVLVNDVRGTDFADGALLPGDAVCAVGPESGELQRVEGLNYDSTVAAVAAHQDEARVKIVVKRLVRRASVTVEASQPGGDVASFDTLAGSNLRMALIQRDIKLYDSRTKRFDMPYAKGDCAGEGLCGTCLVQVLKGSELLSPMDETEKIITKRRPATWRAACRVVVGYENEGGNVQVRLRPQADFEDEL